MTGYFDKLTAWAVRTDGRFAVESTDNGLARWVTVRRNDGLSATGYGATYDSAAVSAQQLFKVIVKRH
jgi:hypothetical protein